MHLKTKTVKLLDGEWQQRLNQFLTKIILDNLTIVVVATAVTCGALLCACCQLRSSFIPKGIGMDKHIIVIVATVLTYGGLLWARHAVCC